ncbi:MAG: sensor N-terminal transmembrane domain-containing protein [Acetobacteraceae bacterium]|nr:sensor N-terminal transmembrane domain-containing protein [Acetobacteraceae bacterium]
MPPARSRWVSPLLRRILLVNALPLALLVVALLYLDQYQNGLLEAEVSALREQARIFAGALAQTAVSVATPKDPRLIPDIARPLLYSLTEPSPDAEAKLYAPDGALIADSRVRDGPKGTQREPLPPALNRGPLLGAISWLYDRVLSLMPKKRPTLADLTPGGAGPEWQPDVKEELRLSSSDQSHETPPYIRRTIDDRLLVTVSVPVVRDEHTVGIVLLTREAREVDASLFTVRVSILALFGLALALTVLLSWYLSLTIARPILLLASAAAEMREGEGRTGSVPRRLLQRRDEVGTLAVALADSAAALWHRMDAIERFAADVAHEIKNPLSSIRSAIETLRRIDDQRRRKQLLAIVTNDVTRLDRLISDVADASRVDAELSRVMSERVDVAPILRTLKELQDATRGENEPWIDLDAPESGLVVRGVEDRLVQVFRNLISNAESFSPPRGRIAVAARERGGAVDITVDDEGPGIPDGKLEQVFDRFYSERPRGERFGQHSGLGLAISKQIVEALRGRITAENRRDRDGRVLGARFVVTLPVA